MTRAGRPGSSTLEAARKTERSGEIDAEIKKVNALSLRGDLGRNMMKRGERTAEQEQKAASSALRETQAYIDRVKPTRADALSLRGTSKEFTGIVAEGTFKLMQKDEDENRAKKEAAAEKRLAKLKPTEPRYTKEVHGIDSANRKMTKAQFEAEVARGVDPAKLIPARSAPDLEHLKRENALPAIPDHVAAGMVTAIGFQGRDYKHQPLSAGETRALDDIARRAPVHAAAVESLKQRSANEQRRVPAGQSTGGRWTK
jgi:hypothetical protein